MVERKTNVLITGGGGYLGSVMAPILLQQGYVVKIIDRFFWGKSIFAPHTLNKNLSLIEADTRSHIEAHFKGVEIVIDLAALSNDPIGELNPQITLEINHQARVTTALSAKKMGVKKYILASSCSVYGFRNTILNETSKTSPVTTYARTSLMAENDVLRFSDSKFGVIILRLGTLYGISPRMRFDLVLNSMVLSAFKDNIISVQGGSQWRPILHVQDAAHAFLTIANAKISKVGREIFNVGSSSHNYQMKDLAKVVASNTNTDPKIIIQDSQADFRSYRVSFEKIKNIAGFKTTKTPAQAAKEIYLALKNNQIHPSIQTKTIDWYKHLLSKNPNLFDYEKS